MENAFSGLERLGRLHGESASSVWRSLCLARRDLQRFVHLDDLIGTHILENLPDSAGPVNLDRLDRSFLA